VLRRGAEDWTVSFGAPEAVAAHARFTSSGSERFAREVEAGAGRGDRALLVAVARRSRAEARMEPVGLIFLADALRADAAAALEDMRREGIGVKMLTGDGLPIAREVARALRLEGPLYARRVFDDPQELARVFPSAAGFAEVLPKDKYAAVEAARKYAHVAVTGDGANDIPSVSDADVGIAVARSVDALQETADIVLITDGLSVIGDAIREARRVFQRLYHYSVYRISESSRLIITIALVGIIVGEYPLTPIQVLLLAFLNDAPIISIAFDRVKVPRAPAAIDPKKRAALSLSYGFAGILNSMLMLWLAYSALGLPWAWIQTLFFLKLVVSGHMLMYVAHTEHRWFRWLPSWQVILALTCTQALATAWAYYGFYTAPIPFWLIAFVWIWSFFWMQVTELFKMLAVLPFRKPAGPPLPRVPAVAGVRS
jgi:H+-transporting ATPase